ncbi:unnamed protein product [Lymnaea stagnalis]|uniref:Homeobox domain-containing protein n=1 Tax=Lymnaea stagnalis TaxID=6523 RepID=A0AAV2INE5_LYMST
MSILQSELPTYTEAQVINSETNIQHNILSLTSQDSASSLSQNIVLQSDVPQTPEDVANFDTFKQNIYRHPLFPLLALMFEKCENSTACPDEASHGFEKEIQAFMKHQETVKNPVLCFDDEVSALMIKAIQVLRIHLMEMEKVNDLCKDFCSRYISCLKGKLTSEQLLHVDGCDSPEPQELNMSSHNVVNINSGMQIQQPSLVTPTVVGGSVVLQQQQQPQIVSGNTVYQMVHTPQGIVAQPIQIQGPLTPLNQPVHQVIHGSTPLSQIGVSLTSPMQQHQQHHVQQQPLQQQQQPQLDLKPGHHRVSDDEDDEKNSKQKRGILPKQATQVMKSWLFQHIVHPYPTEDEKRQIAAQTNLTLLQVNNWFINARRRILQPMLESSNPEKARAKKPSKPGNKPQQRFWPILPNNEAKEDKVEDGEEPKSKVMTHSPKKSPVASVVATSTPSSDRLQQVVVTDSCLPTQQDAYMSFMSNGGLVLRLGPDGHIIPNTQLSTSITLENLQNLQALQSSGFLFAPGPPSLPFNLPLGALSPSSTAALGLGVGPFSNLGPSPMSLGALNFTTYSTPLQFANCLNAAPIDLSTMSNSTSLQLNALAAGAMNSQHLNNGQVLMGVSLQDQNGDQSFDDESLEAGELKIDTREVRNGNDLA